MFDDYNARPLTNREPIRYQCSQCGKCCRNVRDSVMLEALDAFRLLEHLWKTEPKRSARELLEEHAELRLLSRGYSIYVLKTVNNSGVCGFLQDNQCSIYPVRPRTCRLYPFALEPLGDRMQWHLCLEQLHHFQGSHTTAREWERKNLSAEDKAFLKMELELLPKLGDLMKRIPNKHLPKAEAMAVAYTYHSYAPGEPFLPQYRENMALLVQQLEKLATSKAKQS